MYSRQRDANPTGACADAGEKYVRPPSMRFGRDATLGLDAIPVKCVHDIDFSFWIGMRRGAYYSVSH